MTNQTPPTSKQTALHAWHLAHGARMVDFAGYQLPIQYPTGILKEHSAVRESCGLFDVSHMLQTVITGKHPDMITPTHVDAKVLSALERVFPMDVAALGAGKAKYGYMLNEQGNIVDDVILTRRQHDFFLVSNAGRRAEDIAHLQRYLSELSLTHLSGQGLIAVQGPSAGALVEKLFPEVSTTRFMDSLFAKWRGAEVALSRLGYTGEDGFELSVPDDQLVSLTEAIVAAGALPCGLGARDSLRLEAGLCLYGNDIDETTSPIEASLGMFLRKTLAQVPCIGSATVLSHQATGVTRKRVGLSAEGTMPMRAHVVLVNESGEKIGEITSGTLSPVLKKPIAMAYIDPAYAKGDAPIYAQVREHRVRCQVTKMPFVPTRFFK